jgi:hypothetical protein
LILIGPGWKAVLQSFYEYMGLYIPEYQRKWITTAKDIEQTMAILQEIAGSGKV